MSASESFVVRRRAKPEYVLQQLTDEFVKAAGEGEYTLTEKMLLDTRKGLTVDVDALSTGAGSGRRMTALMRAANSGNTSMVELLLAHDANVNVSDVEDHTALHYAAKNLASSCMELLLSRGADIHDRGGGNIVLKATQDGMFSAHAQREMDRYRLRFARVVVTDLPLIKDLVGVVMNYW